MIDEKYRPKLDRHRITKDYAKWAKKNPYHSGITRLVLVAGMLVGLSAASLGDIVIPYIQGVKDLSVNGVIFWSTSLVINLLVIHYSPLIQAIWLASHNKRKLEKVENNGSQTDDEN